MQGCFSTVVLSQKKKPQKGKSPVTRSRKPHTAPEPFRCEITWNHEPLAIKPSQNQTPEKWVTLKLAGVVLRDEAALLQKCVEALLRIPCQKMILHLGRAPIISERGIAGLLHQAKKQQRTLEIRGRHPCLRRTLEELGLGKAFGLKSPPRGS